MKPDNAAFRNIPLEEDWGDYVGDFDVVDAHKVFFGRSNEEMFAYFSRNVMMRAQDLRFMPKLPFMYYIQGFADFVLSGSYGNQDPNDVANCFLSVVGERVRDDPSALAPMCDAIVAALDFLSKNQNPEYLDIYGDFRQQANSIKSLLTKLL